MKALSEIYINWTMGEESISFMGWSIANSSTKKEMVFSFKEFQKVLLEL